MCACVRAREMQSHILKQPFMYCCRYLFLEGAEKCLLTITSIVLISWSIVVLVLCCCVIVLLCRCVVIFIYWCIVGVVLVY